MNYKLLLVVLFCWVIVFSSCRAYYHEEEKCKSKELYWPKHSTSTKSLYKTKCYYENGKMEGKYFGFEGNGCYYHEDYFSREKEYFKDGKLKRKNHSKGKREVTREYFVTGGLKSKEKVKKHRYTSLQMEAIANNMDTVYSGGYYRVYLKQIDSLTNKVTRTIRKDSIIIRARF